MDLSSVTNFTLFIIIYCSWLYERERAYLDAALIVHKCSLSSEREMAHFGVAHVTHAFVLLWLRESVLCK